MDKRETFDNLEKLKAILDKLRQAQEKANLLLDQGGLTRMEGFISFIDEQPELGTTTVTLDGGTKILLNQIVAVNGQFRSDYSEC
jgi:hypothetical protein